MTDAEDGRDGLIKMRRIKIRLAAGMAAAALNR
jgi:hypothetical protein